MDGRTLLPLSRNNTRKMLQANKFRQLQRSAAVAPRISSSPLAVLVNTFATQVRLFTFSSLLLSVYVYAFRHVVRPPF